MMLARDDRIKTQAYRGIFTHGKKLSRSCLKPIHRHSKCSPQDPFYPKGERLSHSVIQYSPLIFDNSGKKKGAPDPNPVDLTKASLEK